MTADWLRKQYFVVPVKDKRSLNIAFPITDMSAHYRSKPYRYLVHLIGHEGRGSLLSELKANNWCTTLTAGNLLWWPTVGIEFDYFDINVDLTDDGINHTDDIIALIFQYITMLKSEGITQWIWDESKQMLEIGFHYKDRSQPINYVLSLADKLLLYPIEEVLRVSYLMDEYRPELIAQLLNELSADRMRVRVVGKQFESIADRTERWFGTKYSLQDIPPEKIQLWLNIGLNDRLALPPPNDFIPYNLNVKPIEDNNQTEPQIIKNTGFSRVWYLQDFEYRKPKAYYAFKLTNPIASDNPLNENMAQLFTRLFRDSVNEYLYAAEMAGLWFSMSSGLTGITLYFGGYNDKLNALVTTILDQLIAFKIDPKRFEVFKDIYVRDLKNRHANLIAQILSTNMTEITTDRVWTDEELIQTVDDLTVSNVSQFKDQFVSRFHIEAFIYGNVLKSETIDVCGAFEEKFKSQLKTKPIALSQHFLNREIHLTEGSDYVFETKTSVHKTNGIQTYYQIGVRDTKTNPLIGLLQQILKQPFSDKLRTKQQLGYVVWAYIRGANGVCGMSFLIESDYKPSFLNERIEAYIQWIHKYIEDMNETDFETQRQALITRKLVKPKNLWDKCWTLWAEVMSKEYNFNREEIEVKAIKEITKQDIIDFMKKHLSHDSPDRCKLTVSIVTDNPINEKDGKDCNTDDMPTPTTISHSSGSADDITQLLFSSQCIKKWLFHLALKDIIGSFSQMDLTIQEVLRKSDGFSLELRLEFYISIDKALDMKTGQKLIPKLSDISDSQVIDVMPVRPELMLNQSPAISAAYKYSLTESRNNRVKSWAMFSLSGLSDTMGL
ncbi:unnamed protein product [Medioppia subpectinata]|uniref:Insulin-degrading enzyme n=1 Tax=Medioppia subpectinata TaxID=1979941 RepID=A0A7R9Q478_9ACAR|nr:unnamed protein product [Medioppia subpectinata]CAG2111287.1 unnamed protein product [Medioppia subpectinata]